MNQLGTAALIARLTRRLCALAAGVSLDRRSDARRVLPTIAPPHLWRALPGVLEDALELSSRIDRDDGPTQTQIEFISNLRSAIIGRTGDGTRHPEGGAT